MIVSKCWCCAQPQEDSFQHLFLKSETEVWKIFLQAAGLVVNLIQVHQVIRAWWNTQCCPKLKLLFQAVSAVITWELWKNRYTMKYEGAISCNRVLHEVNKTLYYLARVRYP